MLGRVVRAHCWVLRKRAAPVFLGARSVVAAAAVVVVVVSGWCRGWGCGSSAAGPVFRAYRPGLLPSSSLWWGSEWVGCRGGGSVLVGCLLFVNCIVDASVLIVVAALRV
jgi:hypothetical protein